MYAQSVFIYKLRQVMAKGFVVGLRETIHDYDDMSDSYTSIVVSDTQFQSKGEKMFYKDASASTWNTEPLEDPFDFLMNILDGTGVEQAYALQDNKAIIIWTENDGWISASKLRELFVPKGLFQRPSLDDAQPTSLKCLSAKIAFDTIGPLKMREYAHVMDYEVIMCVFQPRVWWVPM